MTVDHANRHCDLEVAEVCTPLWQVQHDLESLGEETAAAWPSNGMSFVVEIMHAPSSKRLSWVPSRPAGIKACWLLNCVGPRSMSKFRRFFVGTGVAHQIELAQLLFPKRKPCTATT